MRLWYAIFLLFCFPSCTLETDYDMVTPRQRYARENVILDLEDRTRPKTPVIVSEPQVGEWSNSPTWGSGYYGPMPTSVGAELPVFSLDRTYGPPAVHTVNLSSSANIGATNGDLRARIRFGAGAVQNEFLCDFFNGAQFSLVADHLRITALTFQPNVDLNYNAANGKIQLTASVGRGGTSQSAPLTFTEQYRQFNPAASASYNVPPYAKAFVLYMTGNSDPSSLTDVAVVLVGSPSTVISYDAQIFAGAQPMILPGTTQSITLTNNSVGVKFIQPQWILGI